MAADNITFIKVFGFAKEYAANKYRPFTSEDVRVAFEKLNPDIVFQNYGGVMISLSKSGLIIENGSVKAKLPAAKGRRVIEWISKRYSEQQSKNRKLPEAETSQINFLDQLQIK